MASLKQIRDKANAKLTPFWQMLIDKQPLFFNKHGRFFQALVTPESIDGAELNFTLTHPSDEDFTVDVDFPWTDTIPFQVQVDVYESERQHGFSATATVQLANGDVYKRTRTAKAIIQEPVYNTTQEPSVQISGRICTSFTQEDTGWYQFIEEPLT